MKGFSKRLGEVREYYFSSKLKEVQTLREAGHQIINMGIGSPDLPPHPSVTEALKTSASIPTAHGYQSYIGSPALRAACSDFYGNSYGVHLDPENEILPLMGSKEGIMHISMAFLDEGDEVLIPNPGYPTYTSVTKLLNAKPVFYPLSEERNWEPDLEELEHMDLSRVKLMWVNYPHMPTGAAGSLEMFGRLLAFAKKHQILIVNDNPYSFVLYENPISILSLPDAKENAMELNSLSKTFNIPGWRVGMLAGKKEYLEAVLRVKSNMDSGMFLGIQEGAVAALKLGKEWFDQNNAVYARRRELVWQLAEAMGLTILKQPGGMFVWTKVPEGINALDLVDRLLYEKHIFVTPGMIFGSAGEGYIRFSLCVSEERILEAKRRIVK
ncbi:pyridoxal phosphate-dependent aminotransferase [Lunatibacter salilacus]|uniref:pyridoxal phosphate-dependent aminotransferase n=1 Tax=Lunatibacter salilacus TaxID=2483804 RepID=UPI00131DE254|nr:aminotransferase class I/II-fold pyridoxal phosphate-dependent enzyme [Lunatibacter salilacus]